MPDVLWEYDSHHNSSRVCAGPIILDDNCLIGESAGLITLLSLNIGEVVWQMDFHPAIQYAVRVDDVYAIVVAESGNISKVDINAGKICWTVAIGGDCRSFPLIVETVLYVGCDDGKLYCLLLDSGDVLFEFDAEEPVRSGVLGYGDMVIFGSDDYNLYCYSVIDKTLIWKRLLDGWVRSRPVLFASSNWVNDSVLVGAWNEMQCLDILTGDVRWAYPTNGEIWTTPLLHGDNLVFGNFSRRLFCLNPIDGSIRWFRDFCNSEQPLHSAVEYIDSAFLLPCGTSVCCVRHFDGTIVWRVEHFAPFASPAVTRELVLVPCYDVTLRCFRS